MESALPLDQELNPWLAAGRVASAVELRGIYA
jgi:hypothetical protein